MWRCGVLLPLIGCAVPVAPQIANLPDDRPSKILHESYSVIPAELGDVGVEARIHHRARIPKFGAVWIGPEVREPVFAKGLDRFVPPVHFVIGETPKRIGIALFEIDDAAHYAVWIDRADALEVALVDSPVDGDARAVLTQGAGVVVGERHGERRHVELVRDQLELAGEIDASAIGKVWLERPAPTAAEPTHAVRAGTQIRGAADAGARVLATTREELRVAVVASVGAWTEIDARTQAHVRGFVPAPAVSIEWSGFGYGRSGMGMSDTDRVIVAEGACLFDAAEGAVVGVNVKSVERYAYRPSAEHPGWWTVFVDSPWGSLALQAHQRDGDSWESCASVR